MLPHELVRSAGDLKDRLEKDQVLWGIDSLVYELDRSGDEYEIPVEKLRETLELVSGIMRDISGGDSIDPDLRKFLIYHLEEVHRTIIHYRIEGACRLTEKIQQATGAIVLSEKVRSSGSQENSGVVQAVEVLTKANKLIEESRKLVLGGKMIIGLVNKVLPW